MPALPIAVPPARLQHVYLGPVANARLLGALLLAHAMVLKRDALRGRWG